MDLSGAEFSAAWQEAQVKQIREILQVIAHWMAMPLFLLFWIADILLAPQFIWGFLAIRLVVVPLCLTVVILIRNLTQVKHLELTASLYSISLAVGINLMIFCLDDLSTPYYGGLNLVALGTLSFIPFSRNFYLFTAAGIYVPYYMVVLPRVSATNWHGLAVNSCFVVSSVVVCFLIRFFHARTMVQETKAKLQLKAEVVSREEIIRHKTEEAVRLNSLSAQFSPQIVESIRSGKLRLEAGGSRAQICAIFIDIVNSTERVTRIDKDHVEKVLSRFLDETIKTLLKYDVTVDKFLGDGVLAFCNAPMRRADYVSRVVSAALEIRDSIEQQQNFFEPLWQAPLQVRMGIAMGYVNAGFYGSQKYFRSYTAIGPAMNLASRLCSSAEPGQIVVDQDVNETVKMNFETVSIGRKSLKGFEADAIHAYQVLSSHSVERNSLSGLDDCPKCGGILTFETNDKGQFVLSCRSCDQHIQSESTATSKTAKAG